MVSDEIIPFHLVFSDFYRVSKGHAHTTIRVWIVEHNGNGRTWVGTMVHRRRGGRGSAWVAARTAWRNAAFSSIPGRSWSSTAALLTQWIASLDPRLSHHNHIALDALLRAVRRRPADGRVVATPVAIAVRGVSRSRRRWGWSWDGIRLLLGGAHRGVAARRTVIWGAPHRRGHCCGRAPLVVSCAAVRAEAVGIRDIKLNV